jgi:hypothetical protein
MKIDAFTPQFLESSFPRRRESTVLVYQLHPWIPAFAGMTERAFRLYRGQAPIFEGAHEGHEGFGNYYISISYFVLFASFVVKCLFRFRLRFAALGPLRPAVKYLEISASGIGTNSDGESNSPATHSVREVYTLAHRYFFFVKTDLGTMQWTPLRISTTCVTRQSATMDVNE